MATTTRMTPVMKFSLVLIVVGLALIVFGQVLAQNDTTSPFEADFISEARELDSEGFLTDMSDATLIEHGEAFCEVLETTEFRQAVAESWFDKVSVNLAAATHLCPQNVTVK